MCDLHIIKRNNIHSIHVAAKNNMQDWDEDLLNALTDSLVWDIVYGEPKARETREIKRLEKEVNNTIKELKLQGREAQIAYLKENYLTVWGYCSEGKSIDDYQEEKPSWMLN